MARTVATILREIQQLKTADIDEELRRKFIAQKQAELGEIGRSLPDPGDTSRGPKEAGKK